MRALRPLQALFAGACVLDVGCHAGRLSIRIADEFGARALSGLDIDDRLITKARETLTQWREWRRSQSSPAPSQASTQAEVRFVHGDALTTPLPLLPAHFDVVTCFNVTKWIHVNGGDASIRALFERLTTLLQPGGVLVLQPQPLSSYRGLSHRTAEQRRHLRERRLGPDDFVACLERLGMDLINTLMIAEENAPVAAHAPATVVQHHETAPIVQPGNGTARMRSKKSNKRRRSEKRAAVGESRQIFVLRKRA